MSTPTLRLSLQVGRRLRRLRLARNHTIQGVAADLGISPSALSAYELGQRPITLDLLQSFARHYGVTPAMIVIEAETEAATP